MQDFSERLRLKKEQMFGVRQPEPTEPVESASDKLRRDFRDLVDRMIRLLASITVGAALFALIVCSLVISDWWTFIGSPEYHQWKARVEREK
jgi:hypothetical protein